MTKAGNQQGFQVKATIQDEEEESDSDDDDYDGLEVSFVSASCYLAGCLDYKTCRLKLLISDGYEAK